MYKIATDEDVKWLRKTRKITLLTGFAMIVNQLLCSEESIVLMCMYLVLILNAYFYFMWKSGFWNYMDRVVDNRRVLDM